MVVAMAVVMLDMLMMIIATATAFHHAYMIKMREKIVKEESEGKKIRRKCMGKLGRGIYINSFLLVRYAEYMYIIMLFYSATLLWMW